MLQSLSKVEVAQELGTDIVQSWRSGLRATPPPVDTNHPYWPGRDRRYADLRDDQIPKTESLLDCMERTSPVWENKILYELKRGKNVMVVAHANTLRGLVKTIDNISDDDIQEVKIPTGIPIVYRFDRNMKSIPPLSSEDLQTAYQAHMNGLFLEKPGLLKEALIREEEWSKQVPGYTPTMGRTTTPMSSLERSLFKLEAERQLRDWAGQFVDKDAEEEDDGTDGNNGLPIQYIVNGNDANSNDGPNEPSKPALTTAADPATPTSSVNANAPLLVEDDEPAVVANMVTQPCVTSVPSNYLVPGLGATPVRKDAVIVIIRHGKTEHNKLGLFTGWEDAPLAQVKNGKARTLVSSTPQVSSIFLFLFFGCINRTAYAKQKKQGSY